MEGSTSCGILEPCIHLERLETDPFAWLRGRVQAMQRNAFGPSDECNDDGGGSERDRSAGFVRSMSACGPPPCGLADCMGTRGHLQTGALDEARPPPRRGSDGGPRRHLGNTRGTIAIATTRKAAACAPFSKQREALHSTVSLMRADGFEMGMKAWWDYHVDVDSGPPTERSIEVRASALPGCCPRVGDRCRHLTEPRPGCHRVVR